MISKIWKKLKVRRRVPFGPVSIELAFTKTTRLKGLRANRIEGAFNDSEMYECNSCSDLPLSKINSPSVIGQTQLAIIFGVREGFGYSLAKRLAFESMKIIMVSRNTAKLSNLVNEIQEIGGKAITYSCDVTQESSVKRLFGKIYKKYGVPDIVVYGIQNFGPGNASEIELPAFEDGWRHNCLGSFLVSRSASNLMLSVNKGTIILIGSTSSHIGREGHLNLVTGRFGQRGLAQVLSRELWPKGIHVCHVMIDADVALDNKVESKFPQSDPSDISETILFLHNQPKTAWTSELDLRPWDEKFWEHC